jgi:hypothetical protein
MSRKERTKDLFQDNEYLNLISEEVAPGFSYATEIKMLLRERTY